MLLNCCYALVYEKQLYGTRLFGSGLLIVWFLQPVGGSGVVALATAARRVRCQRHRAVLCNSSSLASQRALYRHAGRSGLSRSELGGRPRGQPEAASHGGAGRLGSLVSQASYKQARRRSLSHSELGELRVAHAWLRTAFQQGRGRPRGPCPEPPEAAVSCLGSSLTSYRAIDRPGGRA